MEVGMEIVAEKILQLDAGQYFCLELTSNHQIISEFSGSDVYGFSGLVFSGKRVAASGRSVEYATRGSLLGMGLWEAEEARLLDMQALLTTRIRLVLKTNIVGDKDAFRASFGLKLVSKEKKIGGDFPLLCPVIEVLEIAPRKYSIELTELLKNYL